MNKLLYIFILISTSFHSQGYDVWVFKGSTFSLNEELSKQVFKNVNEHRDSIGESPFTWNQDIYKLCIEHSATAIKNEKWGHNYVGAQDINGENIYTFEILNMIDITHDTTLNYDDIGSRCVIGWRESNGHRGSLESPLSTYPGETAQIEWYGMMGSQILAKTAACCAYDITCPNGQRFITVMFRGL